MTRNELVNLAIMLGYKKTNNPNVNASCFYSDLGDILNIQDKEYYINTLKTNKNLSNFNKNK